MRQNSMAVKRGEFMPKKGNVSLSLWKWFWFVETDTEQATLCCKARFKALATKSNSTTNLMQHFKQKHAAEWEKCCNEQDWDWWFEHNRQKTSDCLGKVHKLYSIWSESGSEESDYRCGCGAHCKRYGAPVHSGKVEILKVLLSELIFGLYLINLDMEICFVYEGGNVQKSEMVYIMLTSALLLVTLTQEI